MKGVLLLLSLVAVCLCDEPCVDGERKAATASCHDYFECVNGTLALQACPWYAPRFDWESLECALFNYTCYPGSDTTVSPPTTVTTSSVPPTPTTPPPECKEGDVKGSKDNCNNYFQCIKGVYVKQSCLFLWPHFDTLTKTCKLIKYKCA